MRHKLFILLVVIFLILLIHCGGGAKSGRGFRMPDGDPEKGKIAFTDLYCHECHTVKGVELPSPPRSAQEMVMLGGETYEIHTYGDLVTSIINPSHRIIRGYPKEAVEKDGKSKMLNFNSTMTVQQMIDLVAFLQSHYKFVPPEAIN
jgi:L-cysteine S-thiosulfotransferase